MYNYKLAVKKDVMDYINENIILTDWNGDKAGLEEYLNDVLFDEDSVTGNASGSYTMSTWDAEENLSHNMDLLLEAIDSFDGDYSAIKNGSEYCDIMIRIYLLPEAIASALDEIEEEYPEYFLNEELMSMIDDDLDTLMEGIRCTKF